MRPSDFARPSKCGQRIRPLPLHCQATLVRRRRFGRLHGYPVGICRRCLGACVALRDSTHSPRCIYVHEAKVKYEPGTGWLGTTVVATPGADAVDAQVAVNPSGQSLVTWNNFTVGGGLIQLSAFDPVSGWGPVLTGPRAGERTPSPSAVS
jgi:hypothetical protein